MPGNPLLSGSLQRIRLAAPVIKLLDVRLFLEGVVMTSLVLSTVAGTYVVVDEKGWLDCRLETAAFGWDTRMGRWTSEDGSQELGSRWNLSDQISPRCKS